MPPNRSDSSVRTRPIFARRRSDGPRCRREEAESGPDASPSLEAPKAAMGPMREDSSDSEASTARTPAGREQLPIRPGHAVFDPSSGRRAWKRARGGRCRRGTPPRAEDGEGAVRQHLVDHDEAEDREPCRHDLGCAVLACDRQRACRIDRIHQERLIAARIGRRARARKADDVRRLRRFRFHLRNPWSRIGPRIAARN